MIFVEIALNFWMTQKSGDGTFLGLHWSIMSMFWDEDRSDDVDILGFAHQYLVSAEVRRIYFEMTLEHGVDVLG